MWPFDNLRRRRAAARIRRAFGDYIEPDLLERLASNPERVNLELKPARIHFLLLLVRDDRVAEVPGFVARAVDIILDANAMIERVSGSLMIGWFGAPVPAPADARPLADRAAAVARLLAELGSNVKIVTGDRDGLYGNIGAERRFNYSFVVPEFGRCLEALTRLDYGRSAEVGEATRGG
jgi:adenylate cyclase